MVPTASIVAIVANIVICFGVPIGGTLILLMAKKKPVAPVLASAAVFFVFQLVIRIPLIQYVLPKMGWYQQVASSPFTYGIFLALTAGIFEEAGRFIGFKTLVPRRSRWIDGVAFGIGHGGIEAVAITGFANINNLVFALAINNGSFDSLTSKLDATIVSNLRLQLTGLPPQLFLMGGVERIFAIVIQIALSILVLYAVRGRKISMLVLAVILHMLIDAPVVILPAYFKINTYLLELIVGIVAAAAFVFIVKSQRLFETRFGSLYKGV